jgi:hypothetical protein
MAEVAPVIVDSVFGCLISGRNVRTDFTQTQDAPNAVYSIDIDDPSSVAEICLFLLPGNEFPPDQGIAVYYALPSSPSDFTLLGILHAGKPSPVFRTGWTTKPEMYAEPVVRLALVVEPISNIADAAAALSSGETERLAFLPLIARDFYKFVQSFAQATPYGEKVVLPVDAVDKWMARFEEKYRHDPNFLLKPSSAVTDDA